jgi:hypothetical protein
VKQANTSPEVLLADPASRLILPPATELPVKDSKVLDLGCRPNKLIYLDEAGNFDFSAKGSNYFVLVAACMSNLTLATEMQWLRYELVLGRQDVLADGFHATEDKQRIRDRVFALLANHEVDVHAVVLDKRKIFPAITKEGAEQKTYNIAWRILFKYLVRTFLTKEDVAFICASALKTKSKKSAFASVVQDVVSQHGGSRMRTDCRPASSEMGCQIADYYAWAIQRKYERGDERSLLLVKKQIKSCFEPFALSLEKHY